MTKEVRYIIEHRKFKKTWEDYLDYTEFITPVIALATGSFLIYKGNEIANYVFGILLIIATFPLVQILFIRNKQLNGFEEFTVKGTSEKNFIYVLQALKTLNIVELDRDFLNLTINAKYRATTLIPPHLEWLTIVCLDDKILVNSRPYPASRILWFRRNAMIDFVKSLNRGAGM